MAKDKSNFEKGLKIAKVSVVPSIGPILLKQEAAALTTTMKLLLSRLKKRVSAKKIAP